MKDISKIDIIDSVKLISQNAENIDFIADTINDIYRLGYNNGYSDAEKYFSDFFDNFKPKIKTP